MAITKTVLDPTTGVAVTIAQSLTTAQQAQARANIGAAQIGATGATTMDGITDATLTGKALVRASTAAAAKSTLGVDQVNNTADADKPVSTAQATALAGKAPVDSGGLVVPSALPMGLVTLTLPFAGNAVPSASLGADGDYASAAATGAIYGPRASGAWPSAPVRRPRLDQFAPAGAIAETYPRAIGGGASGGNLSSGRILIQALWLYAGDTVSNLTFVTGSTAAASPSNQWAALLDGSRNRVAISADRTTEAWAGTTAKTFSMGTPYVVPATGLYFAALVVVATTVPNLAVAGGSSATLGLTPVLSGYADTGLTTPSTCPATVAAPSFVNNIPYCYAS